MDVLTEFGLKSLVQSHRDTSDVVVMRAALQAGENSVVDTLLKVCRYIDRSVARLFESKTSRHKGEEVLTS